MKCLFIVNTVSNVTCHETMDAGFQCVCHLPEGGVIPINGTDCVGKFTCQKDNILDNHSC